MIFPTRFQEKYKLREFIRRIHKMNFPNQFSGEIQVKRTRQENSEMIFFQIALVGKLLFWALCCWISYIAISCFFSLSREFLYTKTTRYSKDTIMKKKIFKCTDKTSNILKKYRIWSIQLLNVIKIPKKSTYVFDPQQKYLHNKASGSIEPRTPASK